MLNKTHSVFEFFAGGGMARMGLGETWRCAYANDCDPVKRAAYQINWKDEGVLDPRLVQEVTTHDLPGRADLVWGSFPCQDLSLAGRGGGLGGERSGTFWPFWELMRGLGREGRAPAVIALENVCGALTSSGGKDFAAIAEAISQEGYHFGALVMDAVYFLPQSRPRLFIVAARPDAIPRALRASAPQAQWSNKGLLEAHARLSPQPRKQWVWWNVPPSTDVIPPLVDLIEQTPSGVDWHTSEETERLLTLMSPVNRRKVEEARRQPGRIVGTVYKRTRREADGIKRQRAEVRFDQIAGCLRTPEGGSSRQTILVIEEGHIRSRLLSPREAARLMGLPDSYQLPARYNQAYKIAGDGLAVPVVSFLEKHLLRPLADHAREDRQTSAA